MVGALMVRTGAVPGVGNRAIAFVRVSPVLCCRVRSDNRLTSSRRRNPAGGLVFRRTAARPQEPITRAGSNLLANAAGMIGKMGDDSASRALRDGHTDDNHLAISYAMLNTPHGRWETTRPAPPRTRD